MMKLFPFKKKTKTAKVLESVFVEIHQNGEILSKTERPFHSRGSIVLSSDPNAELNAPYYPLPSDIRILKITKRGVELDLDPNWEGFTTYEGKIENIGSDRKSAYTHIMKQGDYGSISYRDLRVLIRIGRPHRHQRIINGRAKEYRAPQLDLWLGRREDLSGLVLGLVAASVLMSGFIYGLLKRPDDRPRQFIELNDEYTLPFVHPLHLSQGPESLQESYNRIRPLSSAVGFSQSFAEIALNLEKKSAKHNSSPILKSAQAHYDEIFGKQDEFLSNLKMKKQEKENTILADRRNGLVAVPVIYGETFPGGLVRMQGLLKKWYAGTQETLKTRRSTNAAFKQDSLYDYKEYRNLQSTDPAAVKAEDLSFDESSLYKEANALAEKAESHRSRIHRNRRPIEELDASNSIPLGIHSDAPFSGVLSNNTFAAFNEKLEGLNASVFDPEKPKVIREPMIGSLDPQLVQQIIDKSRFELQLCYELALRRNQGAEGLMEWRWHLDTKGQIFDLELVQNTINDQKMAACIREKIARWKWPRPSKGSIQISYPFYFKPAKG